jgi:hypothetical protein
VASTITLYSNQIDINYPVVGQDNDTQGFRNNFSAIQSAFAVASSELSSLQDNGVKLTETNDFNYNTIKNVTLQNTSELVKNRALSTVSTSYAYVSVDYTEATYHKCNLTLNASGTSSVAFSIINWPPSGNYGRLYLELTASSTSTSTISILGNSKIIGYNTASVVFNQTSSIFYELWTIDNGTTIYGTITS